MKIIGKIKHKLKNLILRRGIKTNRQIVIFESDDWGAVRNKNFENLQILKEKYSSFDPDFYQTYDILETDEDVSSLIQILNKHRDSKQNPAKFTLNFATANPDFEKIKNSNYEKFYYEDIATTYSKSKDSKNVISLVKNNLQGGALMPQLHSREHLNSEILMDSLNNNSMIKDAFDLNIIGVDNGNYKGLDTLNTSKPEFNKNLIQEASKIFEITFGFKSKTFIAPCYVWNKTDEQTLSECGIEYLQGKLFQNIPIDKDKYKKKFHKFGEHNKTLNLTYGIRNCYFEPSRERFFGISEDAILNKTLNEIDQAFNLKKPAVICSHRVNYVSGMEKQNRELNLNLLDKLLIVLKEKYPNLEFMSTDELYTAIKEKQL